MPLISGIYIQNSETPYEAESCYYLDFQIRSALFSIDRLLSESKEQKQFKNKCQYYHYYTDHLIYTLGQISARFVITSKDKGINLERKQANIQNFSFSSDSYPILSDRDARNTIEHIDEHNQKIIKESKGVGGFNLIDSDTSEELVEFFRTNRSTHPYTLDLLTHKILVVRKGKNVEINLDNLKAELLLLKEKVEYFHDIIYNDF